MRMARACHVLVHASRLKPELEQLVLLKVGVLALGSHLFARLELNVGVAPACACVHVHVRMCIMRVQTCMYR